MKVLIFEKIMVSVGIDNRKIKRPSLYTLKECSQTVEKLIRKLKEE